MSKIEEEEMVSVNSNSSNPQAIYKFPRTNNMKEKYYFEDNLRFEDKVVNLN